MKGRASEEVSPHFSATFVQFSSNFSFPPSFFLHPVEPLTFRTLCRSPSKCLSHLNKCFCLSKSVTWTRRPPASRDERRRRFPGWTPRCIWVGVTMVWEEMDTCDPQVCLLSTNIFCLFSADSPSLFFFFSCLAAPVDCTAPRTRGLILSLSCISVCVCEHTYPPHTHTHKHTPSLTRLEATFLLMHTIVTSTEMKDETFINLTWLNWERWSVRIWHEVVGLIVFL